MFIYLQVKKGALPNRNIYVKCKSLWSNNLLSIFLAMVKRVRLSFQNWGQWKKKCIHDPTSIPKFSQLQIEIKESWKLCLTLLKEGPFHIETSPLIYSANQWTPFYMSSCLWKWLRSVCSFVISLISLELR